MEVFLILLVVGVVVYFIWRQNKTEPHAKHYVQTRKDNEAHNKDVYYKRFDFETYPEAGEEDLLTVTGLHIDNRIVVCDSCEPGEELMLVREPDNAYDENAIMVVRFNGDVMGYLPRTEAEHYAPLLDNQVPVKAFFSFLDYDGYNDYFTCTVNVIEYRKP